MYGRKILIAILLTSLVILGGCNWPRSTSTPEISDPDAVNNATVLTVAARLTQSAVPGGQPLPSTATPTQPSVGPVQPTATRTPTNIPTRTLVPTEAIPCDRAAFVSDVTIPDGTEMDPGENFTKTWRLKNTGSCTWTSGYDLYFFGQDAMGGPASVQLTNSTVAPNQTVDVSVDLTAPNSPGEYRGDWKLRNSSNVVFGLGASGAPFYVEIVVSSPYNFSMEYVNTHDCGGAVFPNVKIINTGSEFLQSSQITIDDITASGTLYGPFTSNTPFRTNAASCAIGDSDADPGLTYYIHATIAAPISGNDARFTLKLCSEDNLGGTCVEKSVVFEIP